MPLYYVIDSGDLITVEGFSELILRLSETDESRKEIFVENVKYSMEVKNLAKR